MGGAPRPWDQDEEGRVILLDQTLAQERNYVLFVAEDFEGNRPWAFYRSDSFLAHTQFSAFLSDSTAFPKEKAVYQKYGYEGFQNQTSFLIQSFVENPKTDHWDIRPAKPLLLPTGLPIQAILWVYSEGHHINLELLVSQKKSEDIHLPLGMLNFVGWRRLEVPINLPAKNAKLLQSLSIPVSVKGFHLATRTTQKKGAFHLCFDNLTFVIDTSTFTYPGAEIKDNWGKNN
ncbi:flagellar filament outer layer protein Flaa domain protein [Leptospira ryugenii]|uniref:Flagellar filament outer layer protein Flaa domain protein n=2 Tax=Leptospira ryugenii TaxID=1917863 RepID=A0A2P2DY74_9LEPT|nr:flagellar filament outer layer protein Flaa domain protein [Leptospira ryugenii]